MIDSRLEPFILTGYAYWAKNGLAIFYRFDVVVFFLNGLSLSGKEKFINILELVIVYASTKWRSVYVVSPPVGRDSASCRVS